MNNQVPVIAIDGPGGSGKSTIAKLVAERFGWHRLDSGALYRLIAYKAQEQAVEADDTDALVAIARSLHASFVTGPMQQELILLEDEDVTDAIRTEQCGNAASVISPIAAVREALVEVQRAYRRHPGLVAEGRDMGTVIFADAELKIFLTASPGERARRRHNQLKGKGIDVSLAALSREIAERDKRDAGREVAPLKPSPEAEMLDTTSLGIEQVVDTIVNLAGVATSGASQK
jgi:cytidylate kinase